MRKYLMILLSLLMLLVISSSASASNFLWYMGDNGPHNHNGNKTMDLYWTHNFHGSMRLVMRDFNNTPRKNNMPLIRRVHDRSQADVVIQVKPDIKGGRFKGTHHKLGPDRIVIGSNVDGGDTGERVIVHEVFHAYSAHHLGDKCVIIGYKSVMCKHSPGHLTRLDNWNLRHITNKWHGT